MAVKHKDRPDYKDWWEGNIDRWESTETQTLAILLAHKEKLETQNESIV